ncbi:helix-turn-helix domain-containing protein [Rhizobium grahamii]|uniref:Helix-turn-helix domain-containing protein n=1 Tax=Rhizobium grahamii CCGE 502 TaxID=990285 RepID=S3HGW1_9HYPH|nr:helix-turn-helix domain-containing protein [Rhizobium grahamii]EPE97325.1 hypothetical protein RGCCGE502_14790 [Rhizobium grahamii CCGE 502]
MGKGQDKRGRQRGEPRHLRLYHSMLKCSAWNSLSAVERCTYIALAERYNGSNNGFICFSAREGAEALKVSKNTISRALSVLAERGFIEVAEPGSFHVKVRHATEYRLTAYACDRANRLPSKAFMQWRPVGTNGKNTVSLQTSTVPVMTPLS